MLLKTHCKPLFQRWVWGALFGYTSRFWIFWRKLEPSVQVFFRKQVKLSFLSLGFCYNAAAVGRCLCLAVNHLNV